MANKNLDRWPHETRLDTPFSERVIVRRSEDGEKIETNVPHTLQHRSSFGFNAGGCGERGQFDAALNITHHLVEKHGLRRALSTELVATRCGRKTSKTAFVIADYVKWHYVQQEGGINEPTAEVVQFIRDMIGRIKRADERREREIRERTKKSKQQKEAA